MEGDSRNPRVSLLKKYDIPIDHLSFEYVETCQDKKELERIARILRSGEEGNYPDLVKTVENKLRQIAPDSRVLRVETPVLKKESFTTQEWKELEEDLESWESEMKIVDAGLDFEKKRFDVIGNKNLPEVRKVIESKPDTMGNKQVGIKKIKVETKRVNERIKSGDYAAWDKFDVDKELLKLDLEDEREEEKNAKIRRQIEKQEKQNLEKKIEPLNIDTDSYSEVEQQILASQAKDRGNECFKSGDYEQALKYYKVSLKLCQNPTTYNNRAMTYIKMKNYEEALKDCNEVLKREPKNIKALHRRATCYQNLPGEKHNDLALKDLLQIISLEPTNRVAQTELQALKKKLNVQDIGKKFRMMIEESGNDEMKEFLSKSSSDENKYSNDIDNLTAIRKLPLTYYGPSTSTFQCEPRSMTHRMLSGPTFSSQIMCKCNSKATRQNPLCHRCGERLSRPKQKSKLTTKLSAQPQELKAEVNALNKEIKENSLKTDNPESKTLESEEVVKTNCADNEKRQENGKSEVKTEVKSKSVIDGENEKLKIEADSKNANVPKNEYLEKNEDVKSDFVGEPSEKSEQENNNKLEADLNANIMESSACYEEGNEEIENMINELRNEKYLENSTVCNREVKDDVSKTQEISGNGLLLQECDLSAKEKKNMDNEQCKDSVKQTAADRRNLSDSKGQSKISDNSENTLEKTNEPTDQNVTENDNKCLPSTSEQTDSKPDARKSRNKKKKSKEPRQDGIRLLYSEPTKIVQATKYLKPTSAEPKPESDKSKEDAVAEPKTQFKSFVPSRKCIGAESGVLKSTAASFSSNVIDKDYRMSPQSYSATNAKRDNEGNKENILDENSFKTGYSGGDTISAGSSFEFMKSWESMSKGDESYEKRAEIIRFLRAEDLKRVIGNNLDSDMLKGFLECLEKHFLDNDPKKVTSFLNELPQIPRFGIINLFLNPNERKVLERLIENTEKKGFLLDEEVKNSLKTSF